MPGAGEVLGWAAGQLSDYGAQLAIGDAFALIGLGGTTDNSAVLADIESKLDTISSQLDVINDHLTEITSDLQALAVQLDVSTKQILVNTSEQQLRDVYGEVENRFGGRGYVSPDSVFSVLAMSKSASRAKRGAIAQAAGQFARQDQVEGYWSLIRRVQTPLTVRAGLTDPIIVQWATFLIAEMNSKPGRIDFESYARLFQNWFMEAVSHQLKAFSLVRFAAAKDADAAALARARMQPIMQRQCDLYLAQVDRLAMCVIRPAPSGPTREPRQQAAIPRGCESALLRADILCRSLTTTFEDHPHIKPAERVSGCYGRVLYRSSDLGDAKKPVIPAQIYSKLTTAYEWDSLQFSPTEPQPSNMTKLQKGYVEPFATLGSLSEFACVDWAPSSEPYAKLISPGRSSMRFARYYWPVPNYFKMSVPIAPGVVDYRQQTLMSRVQRLQIARRDGSKIGYYDLNELRFLPANPDGSYGQGQKPDPDNPLPIVVSWLDCWSSTAPGPRYTDAAGFSFDNFSWSGEPTMSTPRLTVTTTRYKHPLEFDAAPMLRYDQGDRGGGAPYVPSFSVIQQTVMQWRNDNLWDGDTRGGAGGNRAMLFTTDRDETGRMLLYLKANLKIDRMRPQSHIWCESWLDIVLDTDPGSSSAKLLYSSRQDINLHDDWTYVSKNKQVVLDYVDLGALKPSTKYVLKFIANMAASCDFNHALLNTVPRFPTTGIIQDQLTLEMIDFGLARPRGTGYKVIS